VIDLGLGKPRMKGEEYLINTTLHTATYEMLQQRFELLCFEQQLKKIWQRDMVM
jgi:hypothetical protein